MGNCLPDSLVGGQSAFTGFHIGKQIQALGGAQQFNGDDIFGIADDIPAFAR